MLSWAGLLLGHVLGLQLLTTFGWGAGTVAFVCTSALMPLVLTYLHFSLGTYQGWLVEHGAYGILGGPGVVL